MLSSMTHYLLLILFFIFLFTAETRNSVHVHDVYAEDPAETRQSIHVHDVFAEQPAETINSVDALYEDTNYGDSTDEYYGNTTISSMMTTEYHLTENVYLMLLKALSLSEIDD